jgi:hypothetical protein
VYRLFGTDGIGEVVRKSVTKEKGGMIYDATIPPLNQSVGTTIRYHTRTGKHDVTDYDWEQYLKFADEKLCK